MMSSRHRREVSRRTVAIGSLLALCLAAGVIALGLAQGNGLRLAMMFILGVAVAAGLLALDEARVAGARMQAELSRERAERARAATSHASELRALVGRIDQLEADVDVLRREQRRAPRSIVIVAQGAHTPLARASRILEIADVVPAVRAAFESATDDAHGGSPETTFVDGGREAPQAPPVEAPELIDLRESIAEIDLDDAVHAQDDDLVEVNVDDFPVIEVVGEFSLEGLALFPRPAGMPAAFPSVEAASVSDDDSVPVVAEGEQDQAVIDLRARQRSHRSA